MNDKRFNFPTEILYPYVYVMGGKSTGKNDTSVMRSCERFNLKTKKW